jgi:hypothetical protein
MRAIFENMENIEYEQLRYNDNYFKEENLYVHAYSSSISVEDLTNALKKGEQVKAYSISTTGYINDFEGFVRGYINDNDLSLKEFIYEFIEGNYDTEIFEVIPRNVQSVRVFSPFVEMKPIKAPEKWTLSHVTKAILAGQIKSGKCDGNYTDDYAHDAEVNYNRGMIDVLDLAAKIIDSPSGWRVRKDEETDSYIKLSVDCHSFNYNTVYFMKHTEEAKKVAVLDVYRKD